MDIVQQFGWNQAENLEDLFFLLQEKDVIDSDLINHMIAMYRLRWGLIKDNLEKENYKLVEKILKQNYDDIHLFLEQVGEFVCTADTKEQKISEF